MRFYSVVRVNKRVPEGESVRTFVTKEAAERCLETLQVKHKKDKFRLEVLEYI